MTTRSLLQAGSYISLRLATGQHKIVKLLPDTDIALGKYGSIPANLIIGKPLYLTYELLDKSPKGSTKIRIVTAAELHAETLSENVLSSTESRDEPALDRQGDTDDFELVTDDGKVLIRNNQLTIDDGSRQTLTTDEIEALKEAATGSGRDIIERIMQSHSALGEKTAFSLAKYTLRKSKKYLRRFTPYPLDVNALAAWMLHERDAPKIMDLRGDTLSLLLSWANVHAHGDVDPHTHPGNRYLVVDDTAGLVTASLAERMDILEERPGQAAPENPSTASDPARQPMSAEPQCKSVSDASLLGDSVKDRRVLLSQPPATANTITVLHTAAQPNLSLLEYFHYDLNNPSPSHPLYTHMRTLNMLQLLEPEMTSVYANEPTPLSEPELAALKSTKRGAYYRKRRRWERTVQEIDQTRAGGFDSLVIATHMNLPNVLHHLVPLVRGGGKVTIYSPNLEPLSRLADLYSSQRRSAFIAAFSSGEISSNDIPTEDFPVDPRLLLTPTLQTVRVREWQVLPGRSHPMMTSRGGPEGYLFTATKVIPMEGVEAKGNFGKKRKIDGSALRTGIRAANTGGMSPALKAEVSNHGQDAMSSVEPPRLGIVQT